MQMLGGLLVRGNILNVGEIERLNQAGSREGEPEDTCRIRVVVKQEKTCVDQIERRLRGI